MKKHILFAVMTSLLVTACQTLEGRHAHAERVWAALETPACDLPCWHTLTPGEASQDDVQAVLDTSGFTAKRECFDLPEDDEEGRAGAICYWEGVASYPIWGGAFQFERGGDECLRNILLYPRDPVSFEEGVAHFGEPDMVWAGQYEAKSDACRCPARNPRAAEESGPDFDLIYPERGLILSALAEQPEQWPCLCRLTWIDAITLGSPAEGHDLDEWWRMFYGYGAEEEGGRFFDFPGWETRFE